MNTKVIIAIYDVMIEYFMTPNVLPDEATALSSISAEISSPDAKNPIASAPHQFQVWKLGEIDDKGNIKPHKELICDCHTLIRPRRDATQSSDATTPAAAGDRKAGTLGLGSNARADA
nr:MAG: nonstructural protein [Microvirus sp.]